jgi:hypothetical protein
MHIMYEYKTYDGELMINPLCRYYVHENYKILCLGQKLRTVSSAVACAESSLFLSATNQNWGLYNNK